MIGGIMLGLGGASVALSLFGSPEIRKKHGAKLALIGLVVAGLGAGVLRMESRDVDCASGYSGRGTAYSDC